MISEANLISYHIIIIIYIIYSKKNMDIEKDRRMIQRITKKPDEEKKKPKKKLNQIFDITKKETIKKKKLKKKKKPINSY